MLAQDWFPLLRDTNQFRNVADDKSHERASL
jgi:hypothetical protein